MSEKTGFSRRARLGGTVAVAAIALAFAGQAFAQGAAATDDSVVIVTSQRKALQSAQQIKKKNDQVVDSIVATDVGKLPDNNVADALARVTGVQIRRDSGEANTVLIRGLPDLATELNGREVFTTTGRYIQLADIPSTMLQRVDVYKTQRADQADGGLAGLIDVVTNKPFDFKGREVDVTARAVYSDKSKKTDPIVSVLATDRWQTSNGEFGLLGGLSYNQRHFHEERAFNNEPQDKSWLLPNLTGPDLIGLIPIKGDRRRTAANVAAQWRPNDSSEYYFEGFVTRDQNDYELDFFVGLPWWGPGNTMSATKIPGTNQLQTLTSHNVNTITSTQANSIDSITQQYAVGGKWRLNDQWRLSTEIAATHSTFDWRNPILDIITTVPNAFVNTNLDGTLHVEYTGMDMNDASKYYLKGFFDRYGKDKGQSIDWRTDLTFNPSADGFWREFKFGTRYVDRTADSIKSYEGNAEAPDVNTNPFPSSRQSVSSIQGLACVSEPMADGGPDYGLRQWATPCSSFLLNNTDVIRKAITGSSSARALDPGSYFSDKEKTLAAYAQAKFAFAMGAIPVDGTVGLRAVRTDQRLKGNAFNTTTSTFIPLDKKNQDTDLLPSAAFKFTLEPDLIARFTAGRSITRPGFAQLNPGISLTQPSTTLRGTGSGGNPNLKTAKSDNYDGTLEWYFAPAGSLTAAAFYKKFDSYIVQGHSLQTINGTEYEVSSPDNTGAGHLDGFEIGYQQFYDDLPSVFSGLGVQANLTFMEGVALYDDFGPDYTTAIKDEKALQGLSKWSYNLVLLYEKNGWTGRLAYNWRSGFPDTYLIVNLPTTAADPFRDIKKMDLHTLASSQLDGYLGYQLNSRVTLTLEGTNLLDTKFKDYRTNRVQSNPAVYPRDTRRYDRTIELGVRLKM